MSNSISVDVQGLSELDDALAELGNAVAGQLLYAALMAGAKPIQDTAQSLAPVSDKPHYRYKKSKVQKQTKTGNKVVDRYNKLKAIRAAQSTTERELVQSGNLRKSISRKRLKGKKWADLTSGGAFVGVSWTGDAFYGRFVEFGTKNMAAKPFLRPAFIQRQNDALDIIKQRLAANIERARRKAAARTGGQ